MQRRERPNRRFPSGNMAAQGQNDPALQANLGVKHEIYIYINIYIYIYARMFMYVNVIFIFSSSFQLAPLK